jgi:hypothetical protein
VNKNEVLTHDLDIKGDVSASSSILNEGEAQSIRSTFGDSLGEAIIVSLCTEMSM